MRFPALITLGLLALFAFNFVTADEEMFCGCPRILQLVCGSDGTTYPNYCELECARENAVRKGRTLFQYKDGPC